MQQFPSLFDLAFCVAMTELSSLGNLGQAEICWTTVLEVGEGNNKMTAFARDYYMAQEQRDSKEWEENVTVTGQVRRGSSNHKGGVHL